MTIEFDPITVLTLSVNAGLLALIVANVWVSLRVKLLKRKLEKQWTTMHSGLRMSIRKDVVRAAIKAEQEKYPEDRTEYMVVMRDGEHVSVSVGWKDLRDLQGWTRGDGLVTALLMRDAVEVMEGRNQGLIRVLQPMLDEAQDRLVQERAKQL